MRADPRADWVIDDVIAVAKRHDISWRRPGGSHVTFRTPAGTKLTVPSRRPIKPVYVRMFVDLIDAMPQS